ncbi:unnamed protein product [Arabis nemorensis]|uniref:ATPase AAA-type core domain-containing protein n=1 Tax=Arabis nemorensis TaxID=586526 RepID=A0A565BG13_9BRAS|nr:unnamed protein product [Arabis nemorensis]
MAWSKKACIVFFDEIDAIGGVRYDDGKGGDNVLCLRLPISLMGSTHVVTSRPDLLDPALIRPRRIDRMVEFCLPDLERRTEIFNHEP